MATDGGAAEDDMNDCSKCCFFRSDAWCYRKLRYVRPDSQVCMQFIGGVTSEEIEELANKVSVLASTPIFISSSSSDTASISATEPSNSPKCLSCGKLLYIERRGRDGYCAECGCYIPRIVYDKSVPEDPQWVPRLFPENNPMTITRPEPLPTVKCRG